MFRAVGEEVVRHERQRELHAREEQDEGEVGQIQQRMRVRPLMLLLFRLLLLHGAIRRGLVSGMRLGQRIVEIQRLRHNQEQGEARSRSEWIRGHSGDIAQRRSQRGPKGKGDGKARPNHSHSLAAIFLTRDVRRNGQCKLNVALAQPTHDATRNECPEIHRRQPERNGSDVARHTPQQRRPSSLSIGDAADDGRSNGLTEAEERAHRSAEEDDVIAVVDGFGEGVLVGVEDGEDAGEQGGAGGGFEVAVEFEEFGEEWEDEGEGDLDGVVNGDDFISVLGEGDLRGRGGGI